MQLSLRPGEKIYMNGAVLRVDRKVTLEILNDAVFLLESHVLQPEMATTPLRQLYFVVQTLLIDPVQAETAKDLFEEMYPRLLASFRSREVLEGLVRVKTALAGGRNFEALKGIRALFPLEDAILAADELQSSQAA